jgi:hypothetical protein
MLRYPWRNDIKKTNNEQALLFLATKTFTMGKKHEETQREETKKRRREAVPFGQFLLDARGGGRKPGGISFSFRRRR